MLGGITLGIQAAYKAGFSNPEGAGAEARWNDLRVFYGAGRWVFTETNIYTNPASPEGRYYIFPPFFAIVCAPLAALGWKVFLIIWYIVSFLGAVAAAVLCARIVRPGARGGLLIALAGLAFIFSCRPMVSDLHNGQVNSLIFFLAAASLYLFVRKQDGASGVVMALAASIKMTALIFLPYFLYKRAYKTAAGMALGLAFTLVLLPMVALGPKRSFKLYGSFYDKMVDPFVSVTEAPGIYSEAGQSLRAAAHRYLTDTNAAHHAKFEVRVNLADLSGGTVWKIVLVGCIALTLASAFCTRANPADAGRRDLIALELGAVLLLMLMVSPMSRKAHFVSLMLPCAAFVNYLLLHRYDPARRRQWKMLLAVVVITFVIFNLTASGTMGKTAAVYVLAFSGFFFAALALWAASCLVLAGELRPVPDFRE